VILTIKYIKILTNILIFSRLLAQQTAGVYGGNASRQRVEQRVVQKIVQGSLRNCTVLQLRATLVAQVFDLFVRIGKNY